MNNVKILDCTLRDGGYYNNWNFSNKLSNNYLKSLSKTSVDIIELGFRKPLNKIGIGSNHLNKFGKFLISEKKFLSSLKIPKIKKISVMIDFSDYLGSDGYKNLKRNFNNSQKDIADIVRIACNYEDKNKIKKIVNFLKSKNYIVCVNLMKFTILNNKQIISFFKHALKSGADYLYLADSFGNCLPSKIKDISKDVKKSKININILGFHSHDNMGNALKNTIAAVNEGFGIIDTSVNGMGRGAGNLKLEDYLNYKKKFLEKKIIVNFVKKFMSQLLKKYKWGKNKYYDYSAKNNIHPTFVQRFLEEKKFDKKHIFKVLYFLKKNNATQYDMNIFDDFFLKTQKINRKKIQVDKVAILCDNFINKKINLSNLKSQGFQISSLNYLNFLDINKLDLIFICNAYRVFTEFEMITKIKNVKLVIPNYKILNGLFTKHSKKIINYNIIKHRDMKITKNFCSFNKTLVLIYALSFYLSNRVKNIRIYGLTQNDSNLEILSKINNYIKINKLNSRIILK